MQLDLGRNSNSFVSPSKDDTTPMTTRRQSGKFMTVDSGSVKPLNRDPSVQFNPSGFYIDDKTVKKDSTFLPAIRGNPFQTPKETERLLIMGEREREKRKLDHQKFVLSQADKNGYEYVDALAQKQIG